MHLADGVLSAPVTIASYGLTAAALVYAAKTSKEEDIPKISLMSATFFALSLISIPVPPTSIHPLMAGLMGIILGSQAPLAFFVALLLQALLFKHGGIGSLGANTLMLSLPAYVSYFLYKNLKTDKVHLKAGFIGGLSVLITVFTLVGFLLISSSSYGQGDFSLVRLAFLSHLPLVLVETIITAFAVTFIEKNKSDWLR